MKRTAYLMLLLLVLCSGLLAVPRNYVVLEIGTGTWCQYCPGAAMGAHDLLENGHPVAVIKNHNGDAYANVYSNTRNSFYGITGYPTAYFDGGNPYVGGSNTTSMYSNYLPRVNARMAVESHFTIGASGNMTGNTINLAVTVAKPEPDTNTNVVLHCVFTESGIPQIWFNQTTVENVNRLMTPDQNGTPVNLATGEQVTINLSAAWNPAWNFDNGEVILFLQNMTTKEILQATKSSLLDLLVSTPPYPAVLVYPPDGATVPETSMLQWSSGGNAPQGYKLFLGTDGGGVDTPTNLVNGVDLGLVTFYQPPAPLPFYSTYYWQIVPYNGYGDSSGCPIWSFNTPSPLTGTKTIGTGGDFSTFTDAINSLNFNYVGTGGVTFNVNPGTYYENPPAIIQTGSETDPIVFQAAPGARINPVIKATGGASSFGIKVEGASWITFDGIDIANVEEATDLVYGYWLTATPASGASHITITNCTVTLSSSNAATRGINSVGVTENSNSFVNITNNNLEEVYTAIYVSGSTSTGLEMQNQVITGNTFTNIRNYAIYHANGINTTINGNTISFVTGGIHRLYGIYTSGTNSTTQIFDNVISGGSTNNQVYLIYAASGTNEIYNNVMSNVTLTGTSLFYGAYLANGVNSFHDNQIFGLTGGGNIFGVFIIGGTLHNVYNNLIHNLNYYDTGNYSVSGVRVNSGAEINLYNNMIYDLRAPGSSNAVPVMGVNIAGGSIGRLYHNSIYLNATGTTAGFSTAALYLSPTANSYELKNNIFVNNSVPGTTGRTVAFWKSSAGLGNLTGTDHNIYYAGTPGAANLIFYQVSTGYQSLEDYQTLAGTFDQNSFTENVPFVSTVAPYDLHIQTGVPTWVEGNALPIAWLDFDIDNEPRNPVIPDIGADEGNFASLGGSGHVVLLSPPNNAEGLDPLDVQLAWLAPETAVPPLYYAVYASSDPEYIFGEYYFETPNTSFDLSAQPAVELGYGNTWYWAVLPVDEFLEHPDPDHPEFMVWNFSTMIAAVADITVQLVGEDIQLGWLPSPGAIGYKIYAATDPYTTNWEYLGWTNNPRLTLPTATEARRFFKVTALTGDLPPEPPLR